VAFVLLSVVLVTVFEIFREGDVARRRRSTITRRRSCRAGQLAAAGVEGASPKARRRGLGRRPLPAGRRHRRAAPRSGDPNPPDPGGYSLFQVEAHVAWDGSAGTQRSITLADPQLAQVK
jgi:hypothetical protein